VNNHNPTDSTAAQRKEVWNNKLAELSGNQNGLWSTTARQWNMETMEQYNSATAINGTTAGYRLA
jgi:hypothetical protein